MRYFTIAIIAMLLLVACAKEEPADVVPADELEDAVREVPTETETETEPEPEPEPEPEAEMSKELKDLLSIADEKVKSFSYTYTEPPQNAGGDVYYVKGDKMKIQLYDLNEWIKGEWITHIYVDTTKKTAVGYCEDKNKIRCPDPDKELKVNYNDLVLKTNKDWLADIPSSAKITGKESLEQRNAIKVEYQEGVYTYEYLIDDYFGLPMEIRITKDDKTDYYKFYDLAGNSVSDSELEHHSAEDVSW